MSGFNTIQALILSTALAALRALTGRGVGAAQTRNDDLQHRVSVLQVQQGRIIEQSAHSNGC